MIKGTVWIERTVPLLHSIVSINIIKKSIKFDDIRLYDRIYIVLYYLKEIIIFTIEKFARHT